MARRILVIDDDSSVSGLLHAHLTGEGYDVVIASMGEEGFSVATTDPPALILLDVQLPDATGFQMVGRFRANAVTKEIPVIMMSGAARFASQQAVGKSMGANDYVLKPFDIEDISRKIHALLKDSPQNGAPKPAATAPPIPEAPPAPAVAPAIPAVETPVVAPLASFDFSPPAAPALEETELIPLPPLPGIKPLAFFDFPQPEPTAPPAPVEASPPLTLPAAAPFILPPQPMVEMKPTVEAPAEVAPEPALEPIQPLIPVFTPPSIPVEAVWPKPRPESPPTTVVPPPIQPFTNGFNTMPAEQTPPPATPPSPEPPQEAHPSPFSKPAVPSPFSGGFVMPTPAAPPTPTPAPTPLPPSPAFEPMPPHIASTISTLSEPVESPSVPPALEEPSPFVPTVRPDEPGPLDSPAMPRPLVHKPFPFKGALFGMVLMVLAAGWWIFSRVMKPAIAVPVETAMVMPGSAEAPVAGNNSASTGGARVVLHGRVVPARTDPLKAPFEGPVTSKRFHQGQTVSSGDVLIVLGRSKIAGDHEIARRAMAAAEQEVQRASKALADTQSLPSDLITSDGLANDKKRIARATQRAAAAEAEYAKQEALWKQNRVKAPYSGVVVEDKLGQGTSVSKGDPIAVISSGKEQLFTASIDGQEGTQLRAGALAQVTSASTAQPFEAMVLDVHSTITERNTVHTDVGLRLSRDQTWPSTSETEATATVFTGGASARAPASAKASGGVITVPMAAILNRDGRSFVWGVNALGQVSLKEVELGSSVNNRVQVLRGLTAGEKYCAVADAALRPGMRVGAVRSAPTKNVVPG